jgi:cellulose synthase/poly-beta-1,6-N-acetylglucosamine synthase-like glycosyltransferase/spore germination protein YaaH/peptidoglycan/xylan/chitin deacetylase (PgdA/CDA1 family)
MSDHHAIFFDPSRRRWWWIKRLATILGLFSVILVSVFCVSLVVTPVLPGMQGITTAIRRTLRRVHLPRHNAFMQQRRLEQTVAMLRKERAQEDRIKAARQALPPVNVQSSGIVAAFYAPWQETGLHSLRTYASRMTHLLPVWVHLTENADGLDFHDWDNTLVPHNKEVLDVARTANLNIVPVLSNAQMSDFDPVRVHKFLTTPATQDLIILQLEHWCIANRFQGINVDFENLPDPDYPLLIKFLQKLKKAFDPRHLTVSVDLEADKPLDWRAVSAICDFVVVMAYDEHGSNAGPGPIASIGWYRDTLVRALRSIPREKLVIGIANYAYDWVEGRGWAEPMTYQGALIMAKNHRQDQDPPEKPQDIVDFDPEYLNPTFWYDDDEGVSHEVWFLDAVTAANEWTIARNYGVRGAAVWVLGSTDPSIWTFIRRDQMATLPNWGVLRTVIYPFDLEFVGEGEFSHVEENPTKGARQLEIDPRTNLAIDENYTQFPTSFVIARTGYKEKLLTLTIDDGPAEVYTDQILDELKKLNVKATFFLIGENAERYPALTKRIWNEGHEIGNHTYTHPNIGTVGERIAMLEINATQRVFQSLLHRSTVLFRPPYNADAEPDSEEQVKPIKFATLLNYITVLEFLDPQDWNTSEVIGGIAHHRTAEEMLHTIEAQLQSGEKGNCILLHDGGGNRSETVRLIPMLVTEMRKQGYRFVPASELIDSTRDAVNPPVTKSDTLMLASDRIVFETMFLFQLFLGIAFVSAIVLGTLRVIFITILALASTRRSRRDSFDETYRPLVSVVIAAYNEEKVIARTIEAVLANDYSPLDIVIIDDGSKDDTAGEVERRFGDRGNVRVIRQENAGKAAALNHGIGLATGEILIALDADTLFRTDTIRLLVRRFDDPAVGAVAGNVKVGNRINPLTYWQAIEYITSQNLDRRAYSFLNSVSVVPGAVGAWRREAIVQAGGYTTDTMAEDMDLTWRIRRIGWKIETDSDAIGYTEAPDSLRALFKQRFRWAFGTLQSLWKHRRAIGRYGWFGRVMLPSLWLFQVAYQALSPLVDLQILWSLWNVIHAWIQSSSLERQLMPPAMTSLYLIAFMYAFFFVIELIGAMVAFKLDKEDGKMLVWLFWQRFLYRQLMYAVLLKSLKTAFSGIRAGWGKLERKGTVELLTEP